MRVFVDSWQNIVSWVSDNKVWFFSGLGTNIICILAGWLIARFSYNKEQKNCLERIIRIQNLTIDFKRYVDLTIAVSGSEYTAPADGCFNVSGIGKIKIYVDSVCIQEIEKGVVTQNVIKGQKLKIEYEKQLDSVKFYYAKEII